MTSGETNGSKIPRWLASYSAVVYAFLYLPILVLVIYSFNGQGIGGFPPRGLTMKWYATLFDDAELWNTVLQQLVWWRWPAWPFRLGLDCRLRWRWTAPASPARRSFAASFCCR